MDTETGELFEPELIDEHEKLMREQVLEAMSPREIERALGVEKEHVERLRRLDAGLRAGTVVPVSDDVVQKVRLGERELERRRRRRKQSKESRRRNR